MFADLEAYICTFPNCDHELVQFPTRAAWADHEFSCHRFETRWNCPECGSEKPSLQDWEKHIQDHGLDFTRPEFQVARTMARNNKARPIETEECLLCRETPAQNRRAFITHVGRHLEELALVVLPRDTEDDSDGLSDLSSQGSDAIEQIVSRKDIQVDGEMKQLKSTRKNTPCPHCPKLFPSESKLRAHVLSYHTRPFTCIFQRYGCNATFGSRPEWKRHINVQHLHLEAWRCDLDSCAEPILSQEKEKSKLSSTVSASFGKKKNASEVPHHDFERKDLFTQHLKRMHAPLNSDSRSEQAAFQALIPEIADRCHRQLRSPPPRSRCIYCSDKIFEGRGSWDERLEHVGKHLEKQDVAIDDDVEDEDLIQWMMANGFMERDAHTGYKLNNTDERKNSVTVRTWIRNEKGVVL